MELFKRFLRDEKGLETVEYAIILGLIVAATITVIIAIGGKVLNAFENANDNMTGNGFN
jgi:Flp pilus assembly pilin Flp